VAARPGGQRRGRAGLSRTNPPLSRKPAVTRGASRQPRTTLRTVLLGATACNGGSPEDRDGLDTGCAKSIGPTPGSLNRRRSWPGSGNVCTWLGDALPDGRVAGNNLRSECARSAARESVAAEAGSPAGPSLGSATRNFIAVWLHHSPRLASRTQRDAAAACPNPVVVQMR